MLLSTYCMYNFKHTVGHLVIYILKYLLLRHSFNSLCKAAKDSSEDDL